MACTDGGAPYETSSRRYYNGLTAEQLEAVLCAVLSNDNGTFNGIPSDVWDEAGVTRKEAMTWWKSHQAAGPLSRERKAALKAAAFKKLTPAERTALGLSYKEDNV